MDKYQDRYVKHQAKKKQTLIEIMKQRHSNRMFQDAPVPDYLINTIKEMSLKCPSSCDRKGAYIHQVVTERDKKAVLGGVLVGGVGWVHRAPSVILFAADLTAYKENLDYMPYLDIGVMVQQTYLVTTELGLSGTYINPNIRKPDLAYFKERFGYDENEIFGGAFAIGYKLNTNEE